MKDALSSRVPVTLVTGFLGAGKTTLVNHLIGACPSLRFIVIENEFGDVGIDGPALQLPSERVFELNDGCVCCTVQHDLVEVLQGLLTRLSDVDHVLIETTGLAEPGPVLRVFERQPFRDAFRLDGVVTVVDGTTLEASLDEVQACREQITYADVLLVNKVDRLDAHQMRTITDTIRRLNPIASIYPTEGARAEADVVLRVGGRPPEASHGDHHHHHTHEDDIQCAVVESNGDVDAGALDRWLSGLVYRQPATLLRLKGVLAIPQDPRRFIINGVRDYVDVQPGANWGEDARRSRIVLIGRHLDANALQRDFNDCIIH